MELVSIQKSIYIPVYDPEQDKYYDKSPFKKYERGIYYECRCKSGSLFNNLTKFNLHINTKTHKEFITNYNTYNKELNSANERIKELQIENEFLTRHNKKLQEKIEELEDLEEFHDFE